MLFYAPARRVLLVSGGNQLGVSNKEAREYVTSVKFVAAPSASERHVSPGIPDKHGVSLVLSDLPISFIEAGTKHNCQGDGTRAREGEE